MGTLCKEMDFFTCLKYRELCSGKHTSGDEAQSWFFVLFFRVDESAYGTFNQFHTPYQDTYVTDVENRVESRQFVGDGDFRIAALEESVYYPVNHLHERMENNQHPDNTEYIEYKMGQCCPLSLCVGCQCGEIGGDGCSDIFTQYEGSSQFQADPAVGTHD